MTFLLPRFIYQHDPNKKNWKQKAWKKHTSQQFFCSASTFFSVCDRPAVTSKKKLRSQPSMQDHLELHDVCHNLGVLQLGIDGILWRFSRHFRYWFEYTKTSWWLNQPTWKICSSNWTISPGKGKNKKKKINHLENDNPPFDLMVFCVLEPLELTFWQPENRPSPKRKRSYSSNHPFSGANC